MTDSLTNFKNSSIVYTLSVLHLYMQKYAEFQPSDFLNQYPIQLIIVWSPAMYFSFNVNNFNISKVCANSKKSN